MDKNKFHGNPCVRCGATLRYKSHGHCVACCNHRRLSYQQKPEVKAALYQRRKEKYIRTDAARKIRRAKRYGLTAEEYDGLLVLQNEVCAICSCVLSDPHIDHSHSNGKVRGLLCHACNAGLGLFKDDTGILKQAILYLNSHVAGGI